MAINKIFADLYSAAERGKLASVISSKSRYIPRDVLVGISKENLSVAPTFPFTLESLDKAAKAFRKIREAQAKGIDANLVAIA